MALIPNTEMLLKVWGPLAPTSAQIQAWIFDSAKWLLASAAKGKSIKLGYKMANEEWRIDEINFPDEVEMPNIAAKYAQSGLTRDGLHCHFIHYVP